MIDTADNVRGRVGIGQASTTRTFALRSGLLILIVATSLCGSCQTVPRLDKFFRESIGLTDDQVAAIRSGKPVAKTMPSREPAEVFLFGAIYIHAAPES